MTQDSVKQPSSAVSGAVLKKSLASKGKSPGSTTNKHDAGLIDYLEFIAKQNLQQEDL